jgi:hypothetical protein
MEFIEFNLFSSIKSITSSRELLDIELVITVSSPEMHIGEKMIPKWHVTKKNHEVPYTLLYKLHTK